VLHIGHNPISGQASLLILDALKDNNTLQQLHLSSYPEDVTKEIRSIQKVINEERKTQGCDVKLEIKFVVR